MGVGQPRIMQEILEKQITREDRVPFDFVALPHLIEIQSWLTHIKLSSVFPFFFLSVLRTADVLIFESNRHTFKKSYTH